MRKLLWIILLIFFISGCAPSVPDGIKQAIEGAHPDVKYLEAKMGGAVGVTSRIWCVAYKPNPSEKLVVVDYYYDNTWILMTDAFGRQFTSEDVKPVGGWCTRLQ